jgi:ElaB/YqjD/DUF883 family membrane-anchored ribosome-binding protein
MAPGNGAADSGLTRAAAGAHHAVDKVASAADEAARKVKPAIEHAAKSAHHAVDRVADAAAPAADWVSERGERLQATGQKVVADTTQYVSANPWKAIGFAVLAGLLIGRIVR